MEKLPSFVGPALTVKDLMERLSKLDPNLRVSMIIEFDGQWEDSVREVIQARDRIVLMGVERLCPEYERLNPKEK